LLQDIEELLLRDVDLVIPSLKVVISKSENFLQRFLVVIAISSDCFENIESPVMEICHCFYRTHFREIPAELLI
jgi:hypothetical protein